MRGVYCATKKDGTNYYRASITFNGKHISLGSFQKNEEANQAYHEADRIIKNHNITIDSYDGSTRLSFEKWVILINYRDNRMYIGTPIYVYAKYFLYYLSPEYILKFDTDDLFYFSSHKIMRRNGHLFVADYGMQVNILNRYGIKNYAVQGKDFQFINGDNRDFRRANLKIINTYQGVSRENKKGKIFYKAKINVPGMYTIGTYKSEEEAAIAYNKAIDILRKAGVKRNYTPNYTENITPAKYADIYSDITISPKILAFKK